MQAKDVAVEVLDDERGRLARFIREQGPAWQGLPDAEQQRMIRQNRLQDHLLGSLRELSEILEERIDAFAGPGASDGVTRLR